MDIITETNIKNMSAKSISNREEKKIYKVSEITANIKNILKGNFSNIYITGEISNAKLSSLGHYFFSLKDEKSLLNCVMFKNSLKNLKFKLKDGLKVIAFGTISVFEKRGSYNFIVEQMVPEGKGALQLAFEQLKEKLMKEGLFDEKNKKPLPEFPRKIGVVTSPTGAAFKDILKVINRRFPEIHIILYPAKVQGENAAETIAKGIQVFNKFFPVDVIIVGRGGGSLEDLWPFNEEIVARAIYDSKIPVISAVGHQIDYTISDFVSDKRAPTPSAAAEIVTQVKSEIIDTITINTEKLNSLINDILQQYELNFDRVYDRFNHISNNFLEKTNNQYKLLNQKFFNFISQILQPHKENYNILLQKFIHQFDNIISPKNKELLFLTKNLVKAYINTVKNNRNKVHHLFQKLNILNPFNILSRGYSITYKEENNEIKIIKSYKEVKESEKIKIRLNEGIIHCEIINSVKE